MPEGLHCFKGHVGRLEISQGVKGHIAVCALVCVCAAVEGTDERERKQRQQRQLRESGKIEEESDTFQEGKRKRERGRAGERLLCSFLVREGILSQGVMSTTASIYTSHLHGNMIAPKDRSRQTGSETDRE